MILDSTFLVDFEREVRRGEAGPAVKFLEARPEATLAITFTIAGELAAGDSLGMDRAKWEEYIRPFEMLDYAAEVGWTFGKIHRALRKDGAMIGANDLWIAATALVHGRPVVTRNVAEFSRVPALEVLGY